MPGLFSRLFDKLRDPAEQPGEGEAEADESAETVTAPSAAAEAEPAAEISGGGEAEIAAEADADAGPTAPSTIMEPVTATTKPRRRVEKPDTVLIEAVDEARAAIAELAEPSFIGRHLGAVTEEARLVTHSFQCTDPAYRGWHWIAVLARAPRSKKVTVCETALLPGEDAIVSPAWLPWDERLRPGDMEPKDVLPRIDDDPNLEPGYEQALTPGADEDKDLTDDADRIARYELGLGRARVLSPAGIRSAAERWQGSDAGPEGDFAQRAEQSCGSCGYLLTLAGGLRQQFGICANEWSPHDGHVVSLGAGCGAHSETDVQRASQATEPAVDDYAEGSMEAVSGQ